MDRVSVLRSFVAKSPHDPFPRYGLAMELKRIGMNEEAESAFEDLLRDFPDYVPTYLMAGTFLAERGKRERARAILTAGLDAAGRKSDLHASRELENALADLAK